METGPYFLFLCKQDRQGLYEAALEGTPYRCSFTCGVDHLLYECLKQPPMAIVVDVPTQIAIGPNTVAFIYDLKMKWPVMRAKLHDDGKATVMCLAPARSDGLLEALGAIASEDPGWVAEGHYREHLRFEYCCRARVRVGERDWVRVHTLNVSASGAFLLTYDDFEVDQPLQIELHDLADDLLMLNSTIRWAKRWEESQELSGVGVAFEPGGDYERVLEELAQQRPFTKLKQ